MKILFIVPYPREGPSNRFRVEQYFPALDGKGIKYKIRPFCNSGLYSILYKKGHHLKKIAYLMVSALSRVADIFRSVNYDVVFIHREASPAKGSAYETLLRWMGRKVIYDFDDAIFLTKPAKVRMALNLANQVIAGNHFLQEYALRYNKNTLILHTPIDTDKYMPRPAPRDNGKIIIGWIGTGSTSVYLRSLKDVFESLAGKYKNIEFRIVGGTASACEGPFIVKKEWSLESEVKELQGFDIGIMPMPDNEWTRGKCAFKVIQYMAVGIPSVASPVGMNMEVIRDGVNGFLAGSDKEWFDKLSQLIESAALRDSIGRNGRKTVEETYSLKVAAPKFLEILEQTGKRAV